MRPLRPRPVRAALLAAAALLALVPPVPARAHNRSLSHSSWQLDEHGARVQARFAEIDLSQLASVAGGQPSDVEAADYALARLRLESGGAPCPVEGEPRILPAREGWRVIEWRLSCPAGPGRTIASSLFREVAPSHLHFARVRGSEGRVQERVLAEARSAWPLDEGTADRDAALAAAGTTLPGYVALGVEHIVSGWDHLAFVAALLLLARTLREVATLVTAFTLAHSVTLALAVLGLVRPEAAAVEALIGFSIALVAVENAWLLAGRDRAVPASVGLVLLAMAALAAFGLGSLSPAALLGLAAFSLCHFALLDRSPHPARLRAALAFAFGLVHGFGFAGILAEMELPRDRLVPALIGFNLGVEIGQLAVVVALWPLLRLVARRGPSGAERAVAEVGSAAICGIGLFWFLTRALG